MKHYLLAACLLYSWASMAQTPNDQQITQQTVRKAKIESHLQFLASDELRGRDTPSAEQVIAAKYLATQLKSYGVKPLSQYPDYLQAVKMMRQEKAEDATLVFNQTTFRIKTNTLLLNNQSLAATEADAIFLNYGSEAELKSADLKGKIVIVRSGRENEPSVQASFATGREKHKIATERGALAIVELYGNKQLPWTILVNYLHNDRTGLDNDQPEGIPHLLLNDTEGTALKYWQEKKRAKAQVSSKTGKKNPFVAYNVIGYTEGNDSRLKDEYVVYSAHYDHVGVGEADTEGDSIYNGARDNATGTVTVLSAAENIGQYPTKRSALFIFFTGEEKGLLGSAWFVRNSPMPLSKMVYCFNSDNAGYNDTSKATIIGLGRTTADAMIQKACETFGLKAIDDPAPEQMLFDRSDNVNFAQVGVPAPTFSLGFTAFDEAVMKHYHQASDQANNLDYDYLQKFFSAYVYSCRLIANAPERPFWKAGDKYFEAGKKLYAK